MITINNIEYDNKTNIGTYQIKVGSEFVCNFYHRASDGLSLCLLAASKAVQENQYKRYSDFTMLMNHGIGERTG